MSSPQEHLESAAKALPERAISRTPPCAADILAAILDHLSIPIMLVDQDARVIYANRAAHLSAGALLIRAEHALAVPTRRDAACLHLAIAKACTQQVLNAIIVGEAGADPVIAVIAPFAGAPSHDDCAVVLMRSYASSRQVLPDVLRELFKLSAAETQIAVAMGRGTDIAEVARDRGVKRNTLRSQLASIMERTGTHRQAELVALVSRIDAIV